ncbi:acyltransferase family protein [Alteromonas flava]|uniref:acyltransferase family protein n=1 Tax=Alteromonas flava TaxID=2048003 RepID=UPI000C283E35|nr:acyltransferase [Alteromonas flava]
MDHGITESAKTSSRHRIDYLDGLRGLAIILVIVFHAYTRWIELVPYGDAFASFPLFKFGYLGVQLFFLISGFVIFMSLDASNGAFKFIYKRWLRLFPAMLACSILIFITASFFHARPNGIPNPIDVVPGLTFISPYMWFKATGIEMASLENAFWSIYVEVKFYVLAAIVYFLLGRRYLVPTLFFFYVMWLLSSQFTENQFANFVYSVSILASFQYFGWFAAGASYYLFTKSSHINWFYLGVLISAVSALVEGQFELQPSIAALIICAFFALILRNSWLQNMLSNKQLLFMGFISYPLYLLHENMMIALIIQLDDYLPYSSPLILPLISITFVSLVAYIIAKYAEPRIKGWLLKLPVKK